MAKKVMNLFKRIGKTYMDGAMMLYKPLIDAGINPIM